MCSPSHSSPSRIARIRKTSFVTDLIDQLQHTGLLTPAGAEKVREGVRSGKPVEEAALGADGLSEEALLRQLAASYELPYAEPEKTPPPRELLAAFPARLLLKHKLLPLE